MMRNQVLQREHNFTYLPRYQGLSRASVSFHLKGDNLNVIQRMMRRYHAILFPTTTCRRRRQTWNVTIINDTRL